MLPTLDHPRPRRAKANRRAWESNPVIETKAIVLIVAMICIATMTSVGMAVGLNGALYTGAVTAVVTIAGYLFRQKETIS